MSCWEWSELWQTAVRKGASKANPSLISQVRPPLNQAFLQLKARPSPWTWWFLTSPSTRARRCRNGSRHWCGSMRLRPTLAISLDCVLSLIKMRTHSELQLQWRVLITSYVKQSRMSLKFTRYSLDWYAVDTKTWSLNEIERRCNWNWIMIRWVFEPKHAPQGTSSIGCGNLHFSFPADLADAALLHIKKKHHDKSDTLNQGDGMWRESISLRERAPIAWHMWKRFAVGCLC